MLTMQTVSMFSLKVFLFNPFQSSLESSQLIRGQFATSSLRT